MDRIRRIGKLLLVVLPLGFGILLTGCGSTPTPPSTGESPKAPPIGVEPGQPGKPSLPPINIHIDKPTIVINNPDEPTTGGIVTGTASSTGTGSDSSTDTGIASSTGTGSGSSTDTGTASSTATATGSSTDTGTASSTATATGSSTDTGTGTGSGTGSSTGTGSGSSTDTGTGSSTGTGTGTGQAALTPEQKAAQEQARIDEVALEAQLQQLVGKIGPQYFSTKGLSPEQIAQKIAGFQNAVPKEIIALQDALEKFLENNDANAWAAAKKRARDFIRIHSSQTAPSGFTVNY